MSRLRKENYKVVLDIVTQALPSPADVDKVVDDFEVVVWATVRSVYPVYTFMAAHSTGARQFPIWFTASFAHRIHR